MIPWRSWRLPAMYLGPFYQITQVIKSYNMAMINKTSIYRHTNGMRSISMPQPDICHQFLDLLKSYESFIKIVISWLYIAHFAYNCWRRFHLHYKHCFYWCHQYRYIFSHIVYQVWFPLIYQRVGNYKYCRRPCTFRANLRQFGQGHT